MTSAQSQSKHTNPMNASTKPLLPAGTFRPGSFLGALFNPARNVMPGQMPNLGEQDNMLAPQNDRSTGRANGIVNGGGQQNAGGAQATQNDVLKTLMAKERLTPEEITTARQHIAALPQGEQAAYYVELQSKNAYKSQRDVKSKSRANRSESLANQDNMCNLTSLAMCLEQLGISNPGSLDGVAYPQFEDYLEALRIKHNLGNRTHNTTFGKIAAKMTPKVTVVDLGVSGKMKRSAWEQKVGTALASGGAVMMSITGHIVRVQAITEEGLVVDDPYGVVNLNKPTIGKNGRQRHTWSYTSTNKNDKGVAETEAGGRKGEDNVWSWAEVEKHSMLWGQSFTRG